MKIMKSDDVAVLKTKDEFVLVLDEKILGPYPATKEMYKALLAIMDHPHDKKVYEIFKETKKRGRIKNASY